MSEPDLGGREVQGFARSIAQVSTLLTVLAVAYLFFGRPVEFRELYVALVVSFALSVLLLRILPPCRKRPRLQLIIETLVMTLFVTAIAYMSGGTQSPLLNLYLLPLVVTSITLGRAFTVSMLVLIFLCHIGLAYWYLPGVPAPGPVESVALLFGFMPIILITVLMTLLAENIRSTREMIMAIADRDDLTDLYNMRAFSRRLDAVHLSAVRHEQKYAIVMIDLDNLKPINDEYGLESGNRAIQLVGNAILRCIRSSDIAARYGGDEFIILLPNSNKDAAEQAIRRIRNSVFSTTLKVARKKMVRVSVSVGLAIFPADGADPGELLSNADRAMYNDKAYRRNREKLPEALKKASSRT